MNVAPLETVPLPKKSGIFGLDMGSYRIYRAPGDFILVNASSALEAIKNSGVEKVFRVERDSLDKNYVLNVAKATEILLNKDQPAAAATPATPAADAPAAATAAPPAEAPKA